MTKYETVIKVLSQVDRETLEMVGKGFLGLTTMLNIQDIAT